MLAKLFEQKCKDLQEEIFHLIEEKMLMQAVILKDSKDYLNLSLKLRLKLHQTLNVTKNSVIKQVNFERQQKIKRRKHCKILKTASS
jgi:hypothetical protein